LSGFSLSCCCGVDDSSFDCFAWCDDEDAFCDAGAEAGVYAEQRAVLEAWEYEREV
jgi:hypothetical protein